MKAILLAAGFGTRLLPITKNTPKCLVLINGKPLLEIWLDKLNVANINQVLINTHYLSNQVNNFIKRSPFNLNVKLVHEVKLVGTAGTLLANLDFFDDCDGMLIHADNYTLDDLKEFQRAHFERPQGCLMTMMTFRTKNPSACGIVEVNAEGILTKFHEKSKTPPGNLANAAIYILSKEFLEIIKSDYSHVKDFSTEVISKFSGKIYCYETQKLFLDIGTPETYKLANSSESK